MSSKARNQPVAKQHGSQLRHEVDRLIQKDRLKDAVKQAKMLYKLEPAPANHRLLERAYFLRARQLYQEGMPTAAAEVAGHLLEFGVTEPGLTEELAPLLMKVGLTAPALALREKLESPEAQSRLLLTAADQVVLHPERAPESLPEIRREALAVRAALEALEAGDEAGALDRLREIARASPLADWRYFVRGLAAHRRGDAEQVAANWDRLDPQRAAFKAARGVRGAHERTGTAAETPDQNANALETRIFGEPILARLDQLRRLTAENRWTEAIRLMGPLRFVLRRFDPRVAERLTRVLIEPLYHEIAEGSYRQAMTLIKSFTSAAEPLAIDPRWNRFQALVWEGPHGDLDEAERYWRSYLTDLEGLPSLSAEDRTRARALVWKHMGDVYAFEATPEDDDGDVSAAWQSDVQHLKKKALECLKESLRLDPSSVATYRAIVAAHDAWKEREKAVAAAVNLLEKFPDDFETLVALAERRLDRKEPAEAIPLLERARRLKPLDDALRSMERNARVVLARHHAKSRRWDEGRAELERAEALGPNQDERYAFLAKRAALELAANEADRAQVLIEEAQRALDDDDEPAPLWLAILIEGVRYGVSKDVVSRFEHLWQTALAKKGKSETAGALAKLLDPALRSAGNAGESQALSRHVTEVSDYIKRSSRIRFEKQDLVRVCKFLMMVPKEAALFEKLARRGAKSFPESPVFVMLTVGLDLKKGPFRVNLRQIKLRLDKALALAQASSEPEESGVVPTLKELLSQVAAVSSSPFGMPFRAFGGKIPKDLLDVLEQMNPEDLGFVDDDFDEDEDDFDEDGEFEDRPLFSRFTDPGPLPGPERSRASPPDPKPKKKKKRGRPR